MQPSWGARFTDFRCISCTYFGCKFSSFSIYQPAPPAVRCIYSMGFLLCLPAPSPSRGAPSRCENSGGKNKITRRQLGRFAAAVSFGLSAGTLPAHATVPICSCGSDNGKGEKPGIFKEGFASAMEVGMHRYEEVISGRKKELFSELEGSILDIGMGTGPNLKYMPVSVSGSRVIGLEPNRAMWPSARKKATSFGVYLTLLDGHAENIELASDSIDNIVCTLTLCSVMNPEQVLHEVHRLLKPGGAFVFIEHTIAGEDEKVKRFAQNILNPLQKALCDGCNLNRATEKIVRNAEEMEIESLERFQVSLGGPLDGISLISPHIAGIARKKIIV